MNMWLQIMMIVVGNTFFEKTQNAEEFPPLDYERTKFAFSLVYPDKLDGLISKLNNIIEYNNSVNAIVVNVNSRYFDDEIGKRLSEFEIKNNLKVIVNSAVFDNEFKYKQADLYLSNFTKLILSCVEFDYIIFDNHDSLCVRHGANDHLVNFDIGMSFGKINGYW